MVAERDLADHVDLNFGCPVPKVTRRGRRGGAALQAAAVRADRAGRGATTPAPIPVTVKMRIGIDDEHQTYLDAGRRAADAGVAAVALHARTAAQRYSGTADWSAIARLRDALPAELPVLGNGDIFSAADALAMVRGPAATASSSAAAAWAGRGSSATWRPRSPGARCPRRRRSGRSRDACAGTPCCSAQHMGAGQGHPRHAQAHRLVPEGLPGRLRSCAAGSGWSAASTSSTSCSRQLDPRPAVPGRRRRPARPPGQPRPGRAARALARRPRRPAVPFGAELEHSGG